MRCWLPVQMQLFWIHFLFLFILGFYLIWLNVLELQRSLKCSLCIICKLKIERILFQTHFNRQVCIFILFFKIRKHNLYKNLEIIEIFDFCSSRSFSLFVWETMILFEKSEFRHRNAHISFKNMNAPQCQRVIDINDKI